MSKTCKMCDKNRHNEYGEPCMSCTTFREKQNALIVAEKVKKLYDSINHVEDCICKKCQKDDYLKEKLGKILQITKIINGD